MLRLWLLRLPCGMRYVHIGVVLMGLCVGGVSVATRGAPALHLILMPLAEATDEVRPFRRLKASGPMHRVGGVAR